MQYTSSSSYSSSSSFSFSCSSCVYELPYTPSSSSSRPAVIVPYSIPPRWASNYASIMSSRPGPAAVTSSV
ncbi:hypothetical protein E2C01_086038 [Portunus trituberculatus]|uniref:Uncharacterized protein n=1 Tax=Portunus trituberculatus TaxID=210409 RepID=A0A5B7JDJ1_PORTR|nr:hypothetical protein [Portunus trituberculatus]